MPPDRRRPPPASGPASARPSPEPACLAVLRCGAGARLPQASAPRGDGLRPPRALLDRTVPELLPSPCGRIRCCNGWARLDHGAGRRSSSMHCWQSVSRGLRLPVLSSSAELRVAGDVAQSCSWSRGGGGAGAGELEPRRAGCCRCLRPPDAVSRRQPAASGSKFRSLSS